jgi:hypothetical protein
MPMRSLVLIAVVLAVPCSAPAEVRVSLAPAPDGPAPRGFLPAALTVADPDRRLRAVVRAVRLRRERGGPALLYAASIPPGTTQSLPVALPGVSAEQGYRVALLASADGGGPPLAERKATITWTDFESVERARRALVDPAAYEPWLEDLPRWEDALVRTVFLGAVIVAVALGAALLIRRPALRTAAVALIALGGAIALGAGLSSTQDLMTRHDGDLVIVTCRRTLAFSSGEPGLAPVYANLGQLNADTLVCRPGRGLTATLRPEDVRIFRRWRPTSRPNAAP